MHAADSQRVTSIVGRTFACAPDLAASIAGRARLRQHRARATILWQGERAAEALLLVDGEAHAVIITPNGQEMRLHVYGVGDLFGECGVLSGADEAAEVIAARDTATANFAAPDFILLIETHACIGLALSRQLIARSAAMAQQMLERTILSATGRICAELARLGRAAPDRTIRPVPVFSEFGRQLQTTRETVSRTINDLKRRGIVRQDGDALVIVAPRMLEEMVV